MSRRSKRQKKKRGRTQLKNNRKDHPVAMEAESPVAAEGAGGDEQLSEERKKAFEQVGREVLAKSLEPAAWAQALAESGGTYDDAMTLYARIRTESLLQQRSDDLERSDELETRRLTSFRKYKEVPVLEKEPEYGSGFPAVVDSVFWHVLAAVGMTGTLLACRIIWPAIFSSIGDVGLCVLVVSMQLIPLLAWLAGRDSKKKLTYSGTAQMTACVALVCSVLLGVQLLSSTKGRHAYVEGIQPLAPPVQRVGDFRAEPKMASGDETGEAEALLAESTNESEKSD